MLLSHGRSATWVSSGRSSAKVWLQALERTAPIARNSNRILPVVIEEVATKFGEAPALLSESECLTYRTLAERASCYARWALDQGLAKGDTVCLLMPNCPEYVAIWLGITSVGGVVALLNTLLTGPALEHCVHVVAPKHIIVAAEFVDRINTSFFPAPKPRIWVHGNGRGGFIRIDRQVERYPAGPLCNSERHDVSIEDRALCIYTSGTTGLPKAANVSHARLMQWSLWFAGLLATNPSDTMYNCLPMYHSVGGVIAIGALLVAGGSVFVRERFSVDSFWTDVVQRQCTLFQYIGELCRYLLNSATDPSETQHQLRICCGNGLRPDIWNAFKSRFRIPHILEFYASTEGNVSLFNIEEKPGALGRIPPYLAHRLSTALIQIDSETEQPVRNQASFCNRCAPNEIGEAIGRMLLDDSNVGQRFEGYTSSADSEKKILRNVFETGDAWYRTGDLMRTDENGYFYFVDRIGDTFRWKGENISTSEVAEAITRFPSIAEASVYGVAVPGHEGRAGMAAVAAHDDLNLPSFRAHLNGRLPHYAVPLFLRIRKALDVTCTFKYTKAALQRDGFNPAATTDALYFNDKQRQEFIPLDAALYSRIQRCELRI